MAALQSLVVVDSDPRSRDAVAFGFERAGCSVHATPDAREALALAATRVPQLVVASTALVGMDAPGFVRAVRGGPRSVDLPIVVVGEGGKRDEVVAAGADDYFARPAFIRDVVTLARLLAAREGGEVRARLDDFGLFFVARALIGARRSAVVTLERPVGRAGELRFHDGELLSARVGKQAGANAFHQLLLWEQAQMHLLFERPADLRKKFQKPVERLLEDGARYVSEFETVAAKVGGPKVVYQRQEARLSQVRRQVPAEVAPVVALFDGVNTLIDVVEDSPFKPFDTIMIAHRLVELEALAKREPPPPSTLVSNLAVKDWLLGNASEGQAAVTVSEEVGRVVAEVQAKGDPAVRPPASKRKPAEVKENPPPVPDLDDRPTVKTMPVARPVEPEPVVELRTEPVVEARPAVAEKPAAPAPAPQPAVDLSRYPRIDPAALERAFGEPPPRPPSDLDEKPRAVPGLSRIERMSTNPSWPPNKPADEAKPAGGVAEERRAAPVPVAAPAREASGRQTGPHGKVGFDALDEEFFAREAELQKVDTVDTFDDLVDPRGPRRGGPQPARKKR
jgi:DNA-binding response OmpR family regulator